MSTTVLIIGFGVAFVLMVGGVGYAVYLKKSGGWKK